MTGNTIVSLIGTLVFFAWVPSVAALILSYCEVFFQTFFVPPSWLTKMYSLGSPVSRYLDSVQVNPTSSFLVQRSLTAAAAALLLIALCIFFYRLRPSEAAGRAMAFKKSQPVIKFLLVVPCSLFFALFFGSMKSDDIWYLFGLVCGLLISYCVIEIIYNFDFRKLFSHKKHLVLCGGASLLFLAFFRFDLSGYDTYIPSEENIASGAVIHEIVDGDAYYNYLCTPVLEGGSEYSDNYFLNWIYSSEKDILDGMRLSDVQDVLAIGENGISNLNEKNSGSMAQVAYHLKNGKTVYRRYTVELEEVIIPVSSVYAQEEYKKALYPVLKADASGITGINYQEAGISSHVDLPDDTMKGKILAAYQKELSGLSIAQRKKESPISFVQFKTVEMQRVIDILRKDGNGLDDFNRRLYYPVYPSFTETISLLKECGINAGKSLDSRNIYKMELVSKMDTYEKDWYYENQSAAVSADRVDERLVIDDPDQIEELLKVCIHEKSRESNQLIKIEPGIEVTAYVNATDADAVVSDRETSDDGSESNVFHYYVVRGQLPDFAAKSFPGISD